MSNSLSRIGSISFGLWLLLANAGSAQVQAPPPTSHLPDLTQKPVMNGIDPAAVGAFWLNWHLVTVRFRLENYEQRFVYANDLAWQALQEGRSDYPDGAMFGKLAYNSASDETMPNTMVPATFSRIQLMMKDREKYPKSNGWTYALYFDHEDSSRESDQETMAACVACHHLVPERDFVFSHPAFETVQTAERRADRPFLDRFQVLEVSALPHYSREALRYFGITTGKVGYYAMPLFTGSQDESAGLMHGKVAASRLPYLLADNGHHRFLVVKPLPAASACERHVAVAANRFLAGKGNPLPLIDFAESCDDHVRWTRSVPTPRNLQ